MSSSQGAGGYVLEDQRKLIAKKLPELYNDLQTSKNATAWFDVMRQCRHPAFLWEIDFIKPHEQLASVNDHVRKSEILLYGSKTGMQLAQGYRTESYQEVCFHTIRAYLRAEEGDFDASMEIFNSLDEWLEDPDVNLVCIRRSNLIMHLFKAHMCMRDFDKSYMYFKKHWFLLKYAGPKSRINDGLWDNMMIMYMLMCFFIEYTDEFKIYLSTQQDLELDNLHKHKKVGLMHLLSNDHSWVVSQFSLPFYNKARSLLPTLPEYEIKDFTPRNKETVIPERKNSLGKVYPGWQGQFFERLCEEVSTDGGSIETFDNLLYSFAHFGKDYTRDHKMEQKLFDLLEANHGPSWSETIYAGCGLAKLYGKFKGKVTCVDVAEQMIYEGEQRGIPIVHSSIEKFMSTDSDTRYDLFFASGLLEHLGEFSIDRLLKECVSKVGVIYLYIETVERELDLHVIGAMQLHRTLKPREWWEQKILPHFACTFMDTEGGFFVFGTTKYSG